MRKHFSAFSSIIANLLNCTQVNCTREAGTPDQGRQTLCLAPDLEKVLKICPVAFQENLFPAKNHMNLSLNLSRFTLVHFSQSGGRKHLSKDFLSY